MSGTGRSCLVPPSGDIIRGVLNSNANSSGPSVGASSLVTDANSALSGGPQLQRSASIGTESYIRLPASPMSFSSNNISGSSVMDGSSIVQKSPHQEQMPKQGASSATSQMTGQEQGNPAHKRPRLDTRQEDLLQQHMIQQLLQRQDLQRAQIQQQQQNMLQSFPQMQRAQIQQAQIQRAQMQQAQIQQAQQAQIQPALRRPFDSGICARRLMQYMYHQRHRLQDNSIVYWRKFVLEYYAPRAKKRWCLSMYDNVGNHAFGAFPQTAVDAWQCDICGCKSGKGFEATFDVLPRLCQIKFDRGVIDELLFLDKPHECRLSNGIMVLEYAKAVQESVYEQLRVVRKGQLRIIFTPELKILSWEFCASHHEEFLSRKLVAPQVSQMLQVAQKYQNAVTESGPAGVSQQDLLDNCNMFASAGRQLAKNLELQSLNDLGFSKRYVRCLQIAEVVNSMKDLIDCSQEHKIGPIETLKNYPRQAATASKLQNQKMQQEEQQLGSTSTHPPDQSTLNKMMSSHMNSILTGSRALNNSGQGPVAVAPSNSYQSFLRNSMSPNHNVLHPATSTALTGPNQAQFQGSASINGMPSPNQGSHQHFQQQAIHQMLQEVMSNSGNRAPPQQSLTMPNMNNGNVAAAGNMYSGANSTGGLAGRINPRNGPGGMSRSNSQKSVSNNPPGLLDSKQPELLPQNIMNIPELDHDIAQEFADSGLFDDAGYGWKL